MASPTCRLNRLTSRPTAQVWSPAQDAEDFQSTPPTPPVARSKQATVLLSSFLTICLTIGYNQCYGVFQEFYLSSPQDLLRPSPSSMPNSPTAQLAFVGTLGAGLTWAGSIFVNPLISRIEFLATQPSVAPRAGDASSRGPRVLWSRALRVLTPRHITVAGVFLMAAGFLSASFASSISQLLITQGVLYGLGSSLLYFPLLGPAPEYFDKHRGTAIGVMLSGGGVGGLVLSPVLRAALSRFGAAWTLRGLAVSYALIGLPLAWAVPASRFPAVSLAETAANVNQGVRQDSGVVDREHGSGREATALVRRRTHISRHLALSPTFLLAAVAAFCQAAGAQLPLTFMPSYSVSLGMGAATGAMLLAVSNGLNAVARVTTGYAGDRFGRLNALGVSLAAAVCAVAAFWGGSIASGRETDMQGHGEAGGPAQKLWLSFVVLYSLAAGGYYALFPATIADVFGIRSYAAVNGFIYFVRGCGTMVGSPVGGTMLGRESSETVSGQYLDVVIWDGVLLLSSALCIVGLRCADARRRGWMWKA